MRLDWKDIWWREETLNISDVAMLLCGQNPDDVLFWERGEKVDGYTTVLRALKKAIQKGDLKALSFNVASGRMRAVAGEVNPHVTVVKSADLKTWMKGNRAETDSQIVERMKKEGRDRHEIAEELLKHYPKITSYRIGKLLCLDPSEVFVEGGTIKKRGERLKNKVRKKFEESAG